MSRHRPTVPFHDAALLTTSERAELTDLHDLLAVNPAAPVLGRVNVLLGRCTHPAWIAWASVGKRRQAEIARLRTAPEAPSQYDARLDPINSHLDDMSRERRRDRGWRG